MCYEWPKGAVTHKLQSVKKKQQRKNCKQQLLFEHFLLYFSSQTSLTNTPLWFKGGKCWTVLTRFTLSAHIIYISISKLPYIYSYSGFNFYPIQQFMIVVYGWWMHLTTLNHIFMVSITYSINTYKVMS